MEVLKEIVALSHEFGTAEYIKGGGGNTSAKDAETLWVKPSGTTLSGATEESYVTMSRAKLAELESTKSPEDPDEREALVKNLMLAAVLPGASGRPSVEAPLHSTFSPTFVVHTHPPMVNGMTCANNGADTCRALFPSALWIDFVDPGYTLCMRVQEELKAYISANGVEPREVFLENHGVFVAADTGDEIREAYAGIMDSLQEKYEAAGVPLSIGIGPAPTPEHAARLADNLRKVPGAEGHTFVSACGAFNVAAGPLTPDHIVYMKAYPMIGEPTPDGILAFMNERGYVPRIISCEAGVFGIGTSEKNAHTSLVQAQDGALVEQFTEAFGGVQYMTDRARDFIDNWEVEAYRRSVAQE